MPDLRRKPRLFGEHVVNLRGRLTVSRAPPRTQNAAPNQNQAASAIVIKRSYFARSGAMGGHSQKNDSFLGGFPRPTRLSQAAY
jgi:hypothetical protein